MKKQLLSLSVLLIPVIGITFAAVPRMMNYQGKLTGADGRPVVDGSYDMVFSIHDAASGGAEEWSEAWEGASAVPLRNGLFNVSLGTRTPLGIPFDKDYWIQTQVKHGEAYEMLLPRQQITSAGYAFRSAKADTAAAAAIADSVAAANITGSISGAQLADGAVTASKLDVAAIDENGRITGISADTFTDLGLLATYEQNIMLNAFRIAVNGSLTILGMVDGIMDEFEDQSGVNTGASANEKYDGVNDLYEPEKEYGGITTATKLMLHGNDGDTVGPSPTITYNGTATIDASTYTWGKGSLSFDGSSAYLSIPDSAGWDIFGSSSDNWTVDFWIKHTDHAGIETILSQYEDTGNFWQLAHSDGTGWAIQVESGGSSVIVNTHAGEITDSSWHHISFVKVANEYAFYTDGSQVSYTQDNDTDSFSGPLFIGKFAHPSFPNWFDGNVDGIRITHSNVFS